MDDAIARACAYLRGHQHADGLWRDFNTPAGASSEWVTAFVAHCLAGVDVVAATSAHAVRALAQRQRPDGGWGYHRGVPSDSDSTAWACLALIAHGQLDAAALERARAYLLAHQDPGCGAFATYAPSDRIHAFIGWPRGAVAGWCSPHACVTATVLQALAHLAAARDAPAVAAAVAYLTARQGRRGVWSSYWWSGVSYATFHALCGLTLAGEVADGAARRAAAGLCARQLPGGGWPWTGRPDAPAGAFETAFALLTLLAATDAPGGTSTPVADAVGRGARWLVSTQRADGAWPARRILRIPAPTTTEAALLDGAPPRGRRARAFADELCVFTTAAVVRALDQARRRMPAPAAVRRIGPARTQPTPEQRLDELAEAVDQQVRRSLANALQVRGLRLAPDRQRALRTAEWMDGNRLECTLAAGELRTLAHRTGAGRRLSARLLAKLPLMLAFGASSGRVLRGPTAPPQADALCGLLNLGIAVLDHIWDAGRVDGTLLGELLTGELMVAACEAPDGAAPVVSLARAQAAQTPRAALALAVVGLFFATLHEAFPGERWLLRRRDVAAHLAAALDAERASIGWQHSGLGRGRLLAIAQEKSTRPFVIMELVSHAAGGANGHGPIGPQSGAGLTLGLSIGRLDDLVDLVRDARTGDLNALALAPWDGAAAYAAATPHDRLQRVLDAEVVPAAACAMARDLERVLTGGRRAPGGTWSRDRERLLCHVGSWARVGSEPPSAAPAVRPLAGSVSS